jgi:hypothetical protein
VEQLFYAIKKKGYNKKALSTLIVVNPLSMNLCRENTYSHHVAQFFDE